MCKAKHSPLSHTPFWSFQWESAYKKPPQSSSSVRTHRATAILAMFVTWEAYIQKDCTVSLSRFWSLFSTMVFKLLCALIVWTSPASVHRSVLPSYLPFWMLAMPRGEWRALFLPAFLYSRLVTNPRPKDFVHLCFWPPVCRLLCVAQLLLSCFVYRRVTE